MVCSEFCFGIEYLLSCVWCVTKMLSSKTCVYNLDKYYKDGVGLVGMGMRAMGVGWEKWVGNRGGMCWRLGRRRSL